MAQIIINGNQYNKLMSTLEAMGARYAGSEGNDDCYDIPQSDEFPSGATVRVSMFLNMGYMIKGATSAVLLLAESVVEEGGNQWNT